MTYKAKLDEKKRKYWREYYRRNRDKRREYDKKWSKNHRKICKKCKERRKKYAHEYSKTYYPKNKTKILAYKMIWRKEKGGNEKERISRNKFYYKNHQKILLQNRKYRISHKNYFNKWNKNRRKIDLNFLIASRLRSLLKSVLNKYTNEGKIYSSSKYGIDWKPIVEKLVKTKPKDFGRNKYEIDHIVPSSIFDLTNKKQVQLAFCPENLEWLEASKNISKSNKFPEELILR